MRIVRGDYPVRLCLHRTDHAIKIITVAQDRQHGWQIRIDHLLGGPWPWLKGNTLEPAQIRSQHSIDVLWRIGAGTAGNRLANLPLSRLSKDYREVFSQGSEH